LCDIENSVTLLSFFSEFTISDKLDFMLEVVVAEMAVDISSLVDVVARLHIGVVTCIKITEHETMNNKVLLIINALLFLCCKRLE
jgi:hypothetical protein